MTAAGGLEQAYRRLLRWYPPSYRRRHEEEILGVLLAAAQPGQQRPGARESLDLVWSALRIRIRMILRGADSQPWAAAFALVGVLLPLLMLLLMLTVLLDRGARYGFGTPAGILIGAHRNSPWPWPLRFYLSPDALRRMVTASPVPVLVLAGLACLGWRRTAAAFAALVPLIYLAISLPLLRFLIVTPRGNVTLYAYGLEALVLLAAPGAPRGLRALRWRPSALLAAATVAAGAGLAGGFWPQSYGPPMELKWHRGWCVYVRVGLPELKRRCSMSQLVRVRLPHGVTGFIDELFGLGPGGWGHWLAYQGTLVAVVAVALTIMLMSTPVNRRVLALLAVPLALGAALYLYSLTSPQPPVADGNVITVLPLLLILLTAVALTLVRRHRARRDIPSRPAAI